MLGELLFHGALMAPEFGAAIGEAAGEAIEGAARRAAGAMVDVVSERIASGASEATVLAASEVTSLIGRAGDEVGRALSAIATVALDDRASATDGDEQVEPRQSKNGRG